MLNAFYLPFMLNCRIAAYALAWGKRFINAILFN